MTTDISRRSLLVAAGSLAAGLAGCVALPGSRETETATETYDTNDVSAASVRTRNGDVTVEPTDGDAVSVDVRKSTRDGRERFADVDLAAHRSDGTLALTVERTGREAESSRVTVDLSVGLPEGVGLAEARSTNGDVDVEGVAGDPTLATTNGDVDAVDVGGFVAATTTNGDVAVRSPGGFGGVETVNGDADVDVPALRADAAVQTRNGDVTARVGAVDARIVARTATGTVDLDGLELDDATVAQREATGVLGTDAYRLRVETDAGDVRLAPL